jgi:hypothetical protein
VAGRPRRGRRTTARSRGGLDPSAWRLSGRSAPRRSGTRPHARAKAGARGAAAAPAAAAAPTRPRPRAKGTLAGRVSPWRRRASGPARRRRLRADATRCVPQKTTIKSEHRDSVCSLKEYYEFSKNIYLAS